MTSNPTSFQRQCRCLPSACIHLETGGWRADVRSLVMVICEQSYSVTKHVYCVPNTTIPRALNFTSVDRHSAACSQIFEARQMANIFWGLATLRDRKSPLLPHLDRRILEAGFSSLTLLERSICVILYNLWRAVQPVGTCRHPLQAQLVLKGRPGFCVKASHCLALLSCVGTVSLNLGLR